MEWQVDAVALAETSHTVASSRAIRSSCRGIGWKALLGSPVRDKFRTRGGVPSFRGLSKGVALLSRLPCYNVLPRSVPSQVWESGRIHCACVQCGLVPVHIVIVYLYPCAPAGSDKYLTNCEVLEWARFLLQGITGPAMLTGDFNQSLSQWEVTRHLLENSWSDLGLLQSRRTGLPPQPTCAAAARHSFQLVNPALARYWQWTEVQHCPDLDKHDLLWSDFEFPSTIEKVPKWTLPRCFETVLIDRQVLKQATEAKVDDLDAVVQQHLFDG